MLLVQVNSAEGMKAVNIESFSDLQYMQSHSWGTNKQ